MFRRLILIAMAAVLHAGPLATATVAYNPGYGNCGDSTGAPFIAEDGVFTYIQGIQATVDATLAGHLCTNPGFSPDNGWFHGVTIFEADGGGGYLSIGIVLCDSLFRSFCDAGNRSQPHYRILNTRCTFPEVDETVDLGNADWVPHQYRIWFNTSNDTWYFYRDNVAKATLKADAWFSCLNPDTGNFAQGGWSSQRSDVGDGWGDDNNVTQFTGQQYRTSSGWFSKTYVIPTDCDANNRPYPALHYQTCWHNYTTGSRRLTIY